MMYIRNATIIGSFMVEYTFGNRLTFRGFKSILNPHFDWGLYNLATQLPIEAYAQGEERKP